MLDLLNTFCLSQPVACCPGVGLEDPKLLLEPELVAAMLLNHIIRVAKAIRKDIEAVVITVPAYFSDQQRQATRAAGKAAMAYNDLPDQVYMINEPTAALYAHWGAIGVISGKADIDAEEWLVVDVGGGTTDISAVSVRTDPETGGRRLVVRATAGDNQLGGANIDRRLQQWALRELSKVRCIIQQPPVSVTTLPSCCATTHAVPAHGAMAGVFFVMRTSADMAAVALCVACTGTAGRGEDA
jgi:hypothetical protein